MATIDPLAAVVVAAAADAGIAGQVSGQVGAAHKYGGSWSRGSKGLAIGLAGGLGEADLADFRIRFEAACYGGNYADAFAVAAAVRAWVLAWRRQLVTTSAGDVLVRDLWVDVEPNRSYDRDLDMPVYLFFFNGLIYTQPVT